MPGGFATEFRVLKTKTVISLAIGFLLAASLSTIGQSLLNDIIRPIITPIVVFLFKKKPEDIRITAGLFDIPIGRFLMNCLQFVVAVYLIVWVAYISKTRVKMRRILRLAK